MAKFRFDHFIDIHWNGYDIVGDGGTIFSIPDQLYEEFESDLRPVEPSLEWTDTNEFQTLTNSVAASTITGLAPIVATATSTGKQISISSATAPDGYVLTADGSGGAAFELSGGGGGGVAVIGTSPISVLTAAGTATVSLNATYSTSTHLHASEYQPLGTYVTSVAGAAPISASTTTAGAATVSVSTGTTSATVAVGSHLHDGTYQPAGTYVTAVNGTAPIAASTDTAGIVSVSLTATYSSSTHTHSLPPTGSIVMWTTTAAPSDWLFCDGSAYSYNTYPALGALLGGSPGGSFNVPDLRDRFISGSATISAASNNTGTFAPNTANIHTHTTDIAHAHADTFAVSTHGDHTHTTNPASTTSGSPSAVQINIPTTGGATAGSGTHTHNTDIAATASGAENTNLTHTVTGGVTSLGATSVTSSNGSLLPKAALLNFIIKS